MMAYERALTKARASWHRRELFALTNYLAIRKRYDFHVNTAARGKGSRNFLTYQHQAIISFTLWRICCLKSNVDGKLHIKDMLFSSERILYVVQPRYIHILNSDMEN
jgi:hypothetical protein